ncbi:MAG: glycosyltransferase [candidate division Zixibacteria bacterium]|nr:glycosyltransferase [candidate division Zixibacteria bacterium]
MNVRIYILVLNYNGWKDTLECLQSLLEIDYPELRILIIDNASIDDSIERITVWLEENANTNHQLDFHECSYILGTASFDSYNNQRQLILIKSPDNLGYAGGNNIGIRYSLKDEQCGYIWILNNDTVVHPSALAELLKRTDGKEKAGICGSTILYYHDKKNTVQALGGAKYNKRTGWFTHIGEGGKYEPNLQPESIERDMDYVMGASMFVRREFVEDVGLLCENYFMFGEEFDWAKRGEEKYSLAFAPNSIVYHKESSSFKTAEMDNKKLYFLYRTNYVITRRYFKPRQLFILNIRTFLSLIKLVVYGRFGKIRVILRGIFDSFKILNNKSVTH